MDDLYDLAQAVLLWKSVNGDKYPAGCEPQNEVGLVRYISKKTNRKTGVEWVWSVKLFAEWRLTAEDPILNSEAASQKRKRAEEKKPMKKRQ